MKVVLFCGGLGTRLRDYSESIPKPLVPIGYRPILWHLMSYYAHFGHKDFVLCLGYRADAIKQYFLQYNECLSNDFVLSKGGSNIQLLNRDIEDWTITFADTGLHSNIGQRLLAVREHLEGEETFLANYADGLTNLPLDSYIESFEKRGTLASFLCVRPPQTFHVIDRGSDGLVNGIEHVSKSPVRINGGYFCFRREIFDYLNPGEDLVEQPFQRLVAQRQLLAYDYDGFWATMDTFRDRQQLEDLDARGDAPWQVWRQPRRAP